MKHKENTVFYSLDINGLPIRKNKGTYPDVLDVEELAQLVQSLIDYKDKFGESLKTNVKGIYLPYSRGESPKKRDTIIFL